MKRSQKPTRRARSSATPPRTRRTAPARDSRRAIVAAATAEFAASGYDGATVDRIAARARVNKAMIYYHFSSKRGLYAHILHEWFDRLYDRIDSIPAAGGTAEHQLGLFVEAVVAEGQARLDMPRIMVREIADGGVHLDPDTVKTLARIPRKVAAIIERGKKAGALIDVDPFLAYIFLLGPAVFYLVSRPFRETMGQFDLASAARLTTADFVSHVRAIVIRGLAAQSPPEKAAGDRA
ncbi:MAG: TetR/AcrR family transcriptional regulator [Vicinamibacterales bacterium]